MDGWITTEHVADVLTIAAAGLAFLGVMSTWLSRPRITVSATANDANSAFVWLSHAKGSSPARNLYLGFGVLDDHNVAQSGEGSGPWYGILLAGESRTIEIFDPMQSFHVTSDGKPASASSTQTWFQVSKPDGVILDLSWQRPMLSWLRVRRVAIWTKQSRANGKSPVILTGWRASKAYSTAFKPPAR